MPGTVALQISHEPATEDSLVLTGVIEQRLKDNLLEQSYNCGDHSEYKLLQVAQELGRYNIRRYKLGYLPTIAAFASYSKMRSAKFNFFNDGSGLPRRSLG